MTEIDEHDKAAYLRVWDAWEKAGEEVKEENKFKIIIIGHMPMPMAMDPHINQVFRLGKPHPNLAELAAEEVLNFNINGEIFNPNRHEPINLELTNRYIMETEWKTGDHIADLPELESKYIPTSTYSTPSDKKREQLRAKRKKRR